MPENEIILTVRIPADLAKLAKSVANSRDETISQVVRKALKSYAHSAPAQYDLIDAVSYSRKKR